MSTRVEPLVARPSLRRMWWIFALAPVFVALCCWALVDGEWKSVWPEAGILLFGGGTLNLWRVVRRGEPSITVDDVGIGGRCARRVVRWEEIEELHLSFTNGTGFLGVVPRPGTAEDVMGKVGRFFAPANRALAGAPINFTVSRLDVPTETIMARIAELAPPSVEIRF